ncbi:hypothetical protein LCGC14_1206090 [marine sediment metagenome]|uniref:Uncharacterized protein n=1 Tax=marine sediment metagenome TaxID=412755 RepID=A0A0F9M2U9_9ZZZZ
MILPLEGLTVYVFDNRKIEDVANGEVVRVRTTKAPSHLGWIGEVGAIEISLKTGYSVTIPEKLIKECVKLLEVTA